MMKFLRGLGCAMLGVAALSTAAAQTSRVPTPPAPIPAAQTPAAQRAPQTAQPPGADICVRLESQLAMIDRGGVDPARAEEIKRYEDTIARQQADLDRTLAQSHRLGCQGIGLFALFTGESPQCGPLNSRVQQMRGNLDRWMSALEQLKSNNANAQSSQRGALVGQLAQNNCGPQYRTAATGPGGFFSSLFGGTVIAPGGDGAPSGTYRTVCVRTCDGYYFPISFSTVPSRFAEDQAACQRLCPAAEAMLYTYRNPGEDMTQAVSLAGQIYTALPNAFRYRREVTSGCSCRRPGESWADALKNADDASTLERGDIVVTDQNEKALSQLPPQKGAMTKQQPTKPATKPVTPTPNADPAAALSDASSSEVDTAKRQVRVVGPPFLSGK